MFPRSMNEASRWDYRDMVMKMSFLHFDDVTEQMIVLQDGPGWDLGRLTINKLEMVRSEREDLWRQMQTK